MMNDDDKFRPRVLWTRSLNIKTNDEGFVNCCKNYIIVVRNLYYVKCNYTHVRAAPLTRVLPAVFRVTHRTLLKVRVYELCCCVWCADLLTRPFVICLLSTPLSASRSFP